MCPDADIIITLSRGAEALESMLRRDIINSDPGLIIARCTRNFALAPVTFRRRQMICCAQTGWPLW